MDGTRGGPPGRSAENWGRKDGIRAGSVSGPWRSAPRAQGEAVKTAEPRHPVTDDVAPPPIAWTPRAQTPTGPDVPDPHAPDKDAALSDGPAVTRVSAARAFRPTREALDGHARGPGRRGNGDVQNTNGDAQNNVTTVDFGHATGRRPFAPEPLARTAEPSTALVDPTAPAKGSRPDEGPVARAQPAPDRAIPPAPARPSRSTGTGLRLPILLALLAAFGIVGAALVIQSRADADRTAETPAVAAAAPVAETPAAMSATAPAESEADREPAAIAPADPVPAPDSTAPAEDAVPEAPPGAEPPVVTTPGTATAPDPATPAGPAKLAGPATPTDSIDELSPPDIPRPQVVRPLPRPSLAATGPLPIAAATATVVIRVGPDMDADRQARIVTALNEAGYGSVEVQPVTFNVARSRLGFFRNEDQRLAEALAALISPIAGDVAVRNYDQLLAEPAPGRLDLWLRS